MAYLWVKGLLVESEEEHLEVCLERDQEQVTEAFRASSCCFETAALITIVRLLGV